MNKNTKPQKKKNPTLAAKNPAVPPKKGPLSQGLKLKPKQVKKA